MTATRTARPRPTRPTTTYREQARRLEQEGRDNYRRVARAAGLTYRQAIAHSTGATLRANRVDTERALRDAEAAS